MKRSRPCKHVRRVKTKKGRKSVVVNRKVKKRRNFGGSPLNYKEQLLEEKNRRDYYDRRKDYYDRRRKYYDRLASTAEIK